MGRSLFPLLFAVMVGFNFCLPALAQEQEDPTHFTLVLRNVELEDALEQLVLATKLNLIYDPDLLTGQHVYCNTREQTAEDILRCITQAAGLDFYQMSSGTYVLIEKAQDEPQYGSLAGIVVDGETGEPLPYANVFLADASTGTATNSAGMFSFASLLTGPHAVVATYVGYEPALDSVWIPADGKIRKQIVLNPAPILADPIVINGMQQRLPSVELGAGELTQDQFTGSGFQGTDDVLYSAGSVTAVGLRPPYVDLHIQGGESSEHQVLLDGVPVFQPVSLGRLLGAFSPLAIGRLTVHKAGFGTTVGSQLSGLIAAEQNIDPRDGRTLTVQVDPLSVNGRLNFGVDLPGQASGEFMVAGRTSVWDVYRSRSLDGMLQDWNTIDAQLTATALGKKNTAFRFTPHRHGSDVSFSDLHAAGRLTLNPFHRLYASFYQGKNNIGTELLSAGSANLSEDAFILLSRDKYRWTNTTALLRHEWLLGARAMGILKVSNSLHALRHNYDLIDSESTNLPAGLTGVPDIERALGDSLDTGNLPDDRNRIRETTLSAQIDYSLSQAHHLTAGLEATNVANRFSLDSPYYARIEVENNIWHTAGYVQDKISLGLQTSIEIGSRFTWVQDRNTLYAEPRIALRYDAAQSSIGAYAVHLGAGVYRQYVNEFDLSSVGPSAAVPSIRFWMPIDSSLAPPLAYHYTANFLLMPADGWQIRLESYYKHQPRILDFHYHPLLIIGVIDTGDPISEDEFIERSSGFAYGGSVVVEQQFKRGSWALGYSYSQAKRRYPGRFDGRLETTPWNEPHRLTMNHNYALTSNLSASLRAHGIWGRTWGFRQAYYDYLAAHNPDGKRYAPYKLTNPSAHEMPPYYQVDAGVAYERELRGISFQLRAEVLNVLDRKNVVDWSFVNPSDDGLPLERTERTMTGIMAVISLRLGF